VASQDDVEQFLRKLKVKLKVFGVVYIDRDKNAQTLLDLDLLSKDRDEVLQQLNVKDYCEGPLDETMHGSGKMWVFGKQVSNQTIYIKITLGAKDSSAICVSFHIAEHALK
jgi:hypothetical protein